MEDSETTFLLLLKPEESSSTALFYKGNRTFLLCLLTGVNLLNYLDRYTIAG